MKEEPLAKRTREAKAKKYNPEPFLTRIDQLMAEKNLSMRHVGIESERLGSSNHSQAEGGGPTKHDVLHPAGELLRHQSE